MAYRTNAADAGSNAGHFPKSSAFAELFKASKFGHVEAGIGYLAIVTQIYCYFCVTLNTGHRINRYHFSHSYVSPEKLKQ
jgi:hypothetical protein